ncbi:MAG TPA: type III PLP-dependent enzyme, partial [Pseudonocardiaceae bacterium]|nr:type III PLP-dependent enzyme [Pseudonocardiaceae bacterium]
GLRADPAAAGRAVIPPAVAGHVAGLPDDQLPAYVYDLAGLREHATAIRAALRDVEWYYAVKANPAAPILRTLAGLVDGFEVASGGELAHVRSVVPDVPVAFGGPAKTDTELAAAVGAGVHRIHVESVHELRRLAAFGRPAEVLLRVNLALPTGAAVLTMGGRPSQFGIDPGELDECLAVLRDAPALTWHGIHAHLASGLGAADQVRLASAVADWAVRHGAAEVNVGGGMAVDYTDPAARYDWPALGAGLRQIAERTGVRLRVEPGRAVTAHHGWYAASVVDVRRSHGETFALVSGGTHHLRTPVAKGHDQPFGVLATRWDRPWPRPGVTGAPVTVAGQLCTPKDVLASRVPVARLMAGDRVVFGMAGAYAWDISHHDFLMHPRPTFHYLERQVASQPS